jgi:hypothetical protein
MNRESIIQRFPICAAFLILVVLASGCVGPRVRTYSGDKLQKSEIAVIKGFCYYWLLRYDCLDIYEIDGSILKATNVEVSPGWHALVIRHYNFSLGALLGIPPDYADTALNFEAGHEYKIKYHFPKLIGIDIIDVTTGAKIDTGYWRGQVF